MDPSSSTFVSMLEDTLKTEEHFHEILEQVHNVKNGYSSIYIPSFLPPKMKELLKELAMVEGEITQLENQIKMLEDDNKLERETTFGYRRSMDSILPPTIRYPSFSQPETMSEEKSVPDFSITENPGSYLGVKSRNILNGVIPKKLSKSFTALKPLYSPLEDSLSLSAKELAPKASTSSLGVNQISESIMKCLIFIFVRLHRTSRSLDIDAGHISRATHYSSSNSISFRADTGWNSKNSRFGGESRQQDPYGIFEQEESLSRDIGHYKNLLIFAANSLDPKCIAVSNSAPLFQKLRVLMGNLEKVDISGMTYQQKLAFWINMYNASVMHAYLKYGVPSTKEKLSEIIDKAIVNIGGHIVDANTIKHTILKNLSTIYEDEEGGTLESSSRNFNFALCSGSRSSPAVRIYRAEGVEADLEKAKTEYLQACIVVTNTGRIGLPGLVFGTGFRKDGATSVVSDLCRSLPASGALRKSMVESLRRCSPPVVDIIPVDFEFRYLLFV